MVHFILFAWMLYFTPLSIAKGSNDVISNRAPERKTNEKRIIYCNESSKSVSYRKKRAVPFSEWLTFILHIVLLLARNEQYTDTLRFFTLYTLCTNGFFMYSTMQSMAKQNRTEQRFSGIIRASAHHCNVAAVFGRKRVRTKTRRKRKGERERVKHSNRVFVGCFGGL